MFKDKKFYSTVLLSLLIFVGFSLGPVYINGFEYKYLSAVLLLVFSLTPILEVKSIDSKRVILIKYCIIVAPLFLAYLIGIWLAKNLSIYYLLFCILLGTAISLLLLKKSVLLRFGIPIIVSYLIVLGFELFYSESKLKKSLINEELIENIQLTLKDSSGYNLYTKKDKLTILEFWNSACGNCIRDFPKFQEFYNENKEKYHIYSVNVPHKRDLSTGFDPYAFIDDLGYSFPILKCTEEDMLKLKGRAYPTVIVIDKSNRIKYSGLIRYPADHSRYNFKNILEKIENEQL